MNEAYIYIHELEEEVTEKNRIGWKETHKYMT